MTGWRGWGINRGVLAWPSVCVPTPLGPYVYCPAFSASYASGGGWSFEGQSVALLPDGNLAVCWCEYTPGESGVAVRLGHAPGGDDFFADSVVIWDYDLAFANFGEGGATRWASATIQATDTPGELLMTFFAQCDDPDPFTWASQFDISPGKSTTTHYRATGVMTAADVSTATWTKVSELVPATTAGGSRGTSLPGEIYMQTSTTWYVFAPNTPGEHRLFKSFDAGASWTEAVVPVTDPPPVFVPPDYPNTSFNEASRNIAYSPDGFHARLRQGGNEGWYYLVEPTGWLPNGLVGGTPGARSANWFYRDGHHIIYALDSNPEIAGHGSFFGSYLYIATSVSAHPYQLGMDSLTVPSLHVEYFDVPGLPPGALYGLNFENGINMIVQPCGNNRWAWLSSYLVVGLGCVGH